MTQFDQACAEFEAAPCFDTARKALFLYEAELRQNPLPAAPSAYEMQSSLRAVLGGMGAREAVEMALTGLPRKFKPLNPLYSDWSVRNTQVVYVRLDDDRPTHCPNCGQGDYVSLFQFRPESLDYDMENEDVDSADGDEGSIEEAYRCRECNFVWAAGNQARYVLVCPHRPVDLLAVGLRREHVEAVLLACRTFYAAVHQEAYFTEGDAEPDAWIEWVGPQLEPLSQVIDLLENRFAPKLSKED